jgi:quinohemoprotein ethanol dehydrogenase
LSLSILFDVEQCKLERISVHNTLSRVSIFNFFLNFTLLNLIFFNSAVFAENLESAQIKSSSGAIQRPSYQHLENAGSDGENWLTHGQTFAEERQSPLVQITPDNISDLGLAWSFDTGTRRGLEASPIVVDGIIYTTGTWSKVFANNAVNGALIWSFDPAVPKAWGANACCDVVNRGVAVLDNKLFFGTIDGRLIALDRFTGDVMWDQLTIDSSRPYTITGAPRIVNNTVIIGNGGAEYGVRGYVSAFDVETGAQRWRFYTVPGDPNLPPESDAMALASKTWTGDVFYKVGGGGTVWDSMAFDPELNLLYIGVGNGSPWNRAIRSPGGGDNLFLSSMVALDASTGEYVWHYQTTPADNWDYTATQHMILAELEIHGELRKVIMQAPKNGFFYVLDRTTGELISAKNYIPINWASHVDIETGRPVETDTADYRFEMQLTKPAPFGGHNWQPMSYSKETGLVYIPAMENIAPYSHPKKFVYNKGNHWNLGLNDGVGDEAFEDLSGGMNAKLVLAVMTHLLRGKLIAWDPILQKEIWRVDHDTMWNSGVLSTKSNLVFQGTGSGNFVAYNATTGEQLWSSDAKNGIIAPPISYAVDGEQYIAVMAGWGGAVGLLFSQPGAMGGEEGRLLVYKLGGASVLPERSIKKPLPMPPERSGNEKSIKDGRILYGVHCMRCHGFSLVSGGTIPDLRYMTKESHQVFDDIVRQGIFAPLGMIGFGDVLSKEDVVDIQNYVKASANDNWEDSQSSGWLIDLKEWFYDKFGAVLGLVV